MISDRPEFNQQAKDRARQRVDRIDEEARLTLLVDRFADKMKERLFEKIDDNPGGGWEDEGWTDSQIIEGAKKNLDTGKVDPIDAANFCAFLWNRTADKEGES